MTEPGKIRNGYILELSEKDKETAREELGEDPTQTKSHLDTLRTAVQQMKHLSVPTDDTFLLTFLRHAKFSQLRAREVLDNHARNRATEPSKQIFTNGAKVKPVVMNFIKKGAMFALPTTVGSGPRTFVSRPALIDPSSETSMDTLAAAMLTLEIAMLDPVTQVNGVQIVEDRRGCNLSQYAMVTPQSMRVGFHAFHSSVPVRYKSCTVYQAPTVLNWAIAFVKTLAGPKVASRIHTSSDEATLHSQMDPRVLPAELGGSAGTYDELADSWYNHVHNHLDYFDKFSSVRYDASKKTSTENLTGAFRKLCTK